MQENQGLPVAFDHVHKIIRSAVWFANGNITIAKFILAQDSLNFILVDVCEGNGVRDCNSTLVFLANIDGWRLLVEPYTKSFELSFDDLLVTKGFENVEDNEYQITRSSD